MSVSDDNTYTPSLFAIPYDLAILEIPFSHKFVYFVIESFWYRKKKCFLSIKTLCERARVSRTIAFEALNNLESLGWLQRKVIDGKKCFVRPLEQVETDFIEESGNPDGVVRKPGLVESGNPDTYNALDLNTPNLMPHPNPQGLMCDNSSRFQEFISLYPKWKDLDKEKVINLFDQTLHEDPSSFEKIMDNIKSRIKNDEAWINNKIEKPLNYLKSKAWNKPVLNPETSKRENKALRMEEANKNIEIIERASESAYLEKINSYAKSPLQAQCAKILSDSTRKGLQSIKEALNVGLHQQGALP